MKHSEGSPYFFKFVICFTLLSRARALTSVCLLSLFHLCTLSLVFVCAGIVPCFLCSHSIRDSPFSYLVCFSFVSVCHLRLLIVSPLFDELQ